MILDIHIETDGNDNNAAAPYILTEVAKVLERQCHGRYTVTHEVKHREHIVAENLTDPRENLYRWIDTQGVEWTCDAYDHGPFCRQCVRVG